MGSEGIKAKNCIFRWSDTRFFNASFLLRIAGFEHLLRREFFRCAVERCNLKGCWVDSRYTHNLAKVWVAPINIQFWKETELADYYT